MSNLEQRIKRHIKWLYYSKVIYHSAVVIIILFALAVRINVAYKHRVPRGDEGAWLRLAVQLPGSEFMTSRVIEHDLYFERRLPHPEDNRSPLYPVLIALFHTINKDAFISGQILNLAVSFIFLILLAIGMHNTFGRMATVTSLIFFAVSPFLITFSTQIYPDLLIALCLIIFLYKADSIVCSIRNSLLGGTCLGLLFLLKTTSLFLIPVFAAAYFHHRHDKDIIKKVILFVAPLFFISLPWLSRNQLAFGSPLFQVAKYTLYMESWANFFDTGLKIPTLSAYIAEQGFIHVLLIRPFSGLIEMIKLFPHFDHNLSLAILPLCIVGIFNLRGKEKLYKPIIWFSIFFIPFVAYIAYNSWVARYVMLYYVLLYCLAGIGVDLIYAKVKHFFLRIVLTIAAIALPLYTVVYPLEFYLSSRGNEQHQDKLNREMVTKTVQAVPDNSVILSPFLSQYSFMHDLFVVNVLNFKTSDNLYEFVNIYGIDYILINKENKNSLWNLINDPGAKFALNDILTHGNLALYKIKAKAGK